jgi:hypothetical protein
VTSPSPSSYSTSSAGLETDLDHVVLGVVNLRGNDVWLDCRELGDAQNA